MISKQILNKHFEIPELHLQKLRKIILETHFTAKDYKRKIITTDRRVLRQLTKIQTQYDEQY